MSRLSGSQLQFGEQLTAAPADLHELPALQRVVVMDRLRLEPLQIGDAAELLDILAADPEIRERVSFVSGMFDQADVQKQVDQYRSDPDIIRYGIVENEALVGGVSLWRDCGTYGRTENTYGFGFFLHPAARGRGIVSASVRQLMDTVAANMPVDSFIAFSEADNPDSVAVLTGLGFVANGETMRTSQDWQEHMYEGVVSNG